MRIGVISDVHANHHALHASLAALRGRGVDGFVVLGDLLSYGCAPLQTLDTLAELPDDTVFIVGNHDQLYFELQRAESSYFDTMPSWIQESATWTARALEAGPPLKDRFAWRDEHILDGVLFSHANPFGRRDWAYLNDDRDIARARAALAARGLRAGVFGHTHRGRADGVIFNPGSVGQPRSGNGASTCAIVTLGSEVQWELIPISYDERAHVDEISTSSLSPSTKAAILKYHNGSFQSFGSRGDRPRGGGSP